MNGEAVMSMLFTAMMVGLGRKLKGREGKEKVKVVQNANDAGAVRKRGKSKRRFGALERYFEAATSSKSPCQL